MSRQAATTERSGQDIYSNSHSNSHSHSHSKTLTPSCSDDDEIGDDTKTGQASGATLPLTPSSSSRVTISAEPGSEAEAEAETGATTDNSQVDIVLNLIRWYKKGGRTQPGPIHRPLSRSGYAQLYERLKHDESTRGWFIDRARHDFDGRQFTLRMPSALHDYVAKGFGELIMSSIDSLRTRIPALQPQLLRLSSGTSADLELSGSTHSPDWTLECLPFRHPSLVLEVSYSQQQKRIHRLVDDYFSGSPDINCVIGLDLAYPRKGSKQEASISIWRPAVTEEDGVKYTYARLDEAARVFRDADGQKEGQVTIHLSDLLPIEDVDETLRQTTISIPFDALSRLLVQSEEQAYRRKDGPTRSERTLPYKRKLSSDDELSDGREKKFRHIEEATEARAEAADSSFSSVCS